MNSKRVDPHHINRASTPYEYDQKKESYVVARLHTPYPQVTGGNGLHDFYFLRTGENVQATRARLEREFALYGYRPNDRGLGEYNPSFSQGTLLYGDAYTLILETKGVGLSSLVVAALVDEAYETHDEHLQGMGLSPLPTKELFIAGRQSNRLFAYANEPALVVPVEESLEFLLQSPERTFSIGLLPTPTSKTSLVNALHNFVAPHTVLAHYAGEGFVHTIVNGQELSLRNGWPLTKEELVALESFAPYEAQPQDLGLDVYRHSKELQAFFDGHGMEASRLITVSKNEKYFFDGTALELAEHLKMRGFTAIKHVPYEEGVVTRRDQRAQHVF